MQHRGTVHHTGTETAPQHTESDLALRRTAGINCARIADTVAVAYRTSVSVFPRANNPVTGRRAGCPNPLPA